MKKKISSFGPWNSSWSGCHAVLATRWGPWWAAGYA